MKPGTRGKTLHKMKKCYNKEMQVRMFCKTSYKDLKQARNRL